MDEFAKSGYLKIANENDRQAVASILFKNGYTVRTVRAKKNGKTYEYFVRYEKNPLDIELEAEEPAILLPQEGGSNESKI